jgi:uncharacterized RDD family membrane protein YckC
MNDPNFNEVSPADSSHLKRVKVRRLEGVSLEDQPEDRPNEELLRKWRSRYPTGIDYLCTFGLIGSAYLPFATFFERNFRRNPPPPIARVGIVLLIIIYTAYWFYFLLAPARTVTVDGSGTMIFSSRRRSLTVASGEIQKIVPIGFARQIVPSRSGRRNIYCWPLVVTGKQDRILWNCPCRCSTELLEVIRELNPNAILVVRK